MLPHSMRRTCRLRGASLKPVCPGLEACLSVGIETHRSAQAVPYDLEAQTDTEITPARERLSPPDCDCLFVCLAAPLKSVGSSSQFCMLVTQNNRTGQKMRCDNDGCKPKWLWIKHTGLATRPQERHPRAHQCHIAGGQPQNQYQKSLPGRRKFVPKVFEA